MWDLGEEELWTICLNINGPQENCPSLELTTEIYRVGGLLGELEYDTTEEGYQMP
jgi:hypothetical protein